MNQCHFLGRLVRDPELREANGKSVVNFGIAVNRSFKKGNERVDEVSFLDMEAWDTGAETIEKYFKKGDQIIVHCSVRTDSWVDKTTEQKRTKQKFRVNSFEFVNSGGKKKSSEEAPEPASVGGGGEPEDGNIPF